MGPLSLTDLKAAAALLTRVPIRFRASERVDPGRAIPWLPLVAGLVGGLVAIAYAGLVMVTPRFIAAVLAIGAGILLTGALHEDGLADFFDALGGGRDAQQRLRILEDPSLGTFGVLALIVVVLARVGALAALDPWSAAAVLPVGGAAGQFAGVLVLSRVAAAKTEGLAATYSAGVTARRTAASTLWAGLIAGVLLGIWGVVALALAGLVASVFGSTAKALLNGITGDVLGATQQITEIVILLLGVALIQQGWGDTPWWRP